MAQIKYQDVRGIFSENLKVRLDIGTKAVKKAVPASHDSWATRLVFKRLDGKSEGEVHDEHLVGIFSEDGKYRLDIGTMAMKENVPASHESWATKLKIKKIKGSSSGFIHYGDVVGIFSEDEKYRLDIGTKAMKKKVPASHDSWATRLRVLEPDPITEVMEVIDTKYRIDEAVESNTKDVELYSNTIDNTQSSIDQHSDINSSESVTETSMWQNTVGISFSEKVTFKTGIPFIAEGKVEISSEQKEEYTWGKSYERQKNWGFSVNLIAPARTKAKVIVSVSKSHLKIPYTMKLKCKTASGKIKTNQLGGIYDGDSSYDLKSVYSVTDNLNNEVKKLTTFFKGEKLFLK